MQKFDTIIIGGGPGGTPAAIQLASKGKKVLLVEKSGKLGGACLFVGCIPSKIIKHSADEYALLKTTHLLKEISLEDKKDLWDGIKKKMDEILTLRSNAARQHINKLSNLTFSSGISRFISNDEIEIEEINGTRNRYSFDNAIIATGSLPFIPEFNGNAVQDVLKSEMLFKENALPKSMTIIGGGPIGIELAQMLTKLNVECTIIEMMDTILSGVVEPEFVQALTQKLTASGINVFTSTKVLEINKSGRKYNTIITDKKGLKNVISSEQVMVAAGRIPNVEDLDLGATDIRFNRHGIIVNEFLETSVKGIYATGDVIEGPKFAHTATYEAHIAGANILLGNIHKKDFSKNSWVLFSDPEIASAGYTELEAVNNGFKVLTGVYNYEIDAAAQITGNPCGYLKFVVDRKTNEFLGIHIFTQGASSIIGEAALMVSKRLTLRDIAQTIHPHPTLTEAFGFLAQNMIG